MAITLTGKLEDITARPVEDITRVTVKAPVARPGAAITTSQPRTVDLGKDGTITFDAVEGPGWLYIEGPGWSDSIKFVAAAGMTQLWEAVVNAIGLPANITEFLNIKDALNGMIESTIAGIAKNYPFDKWSRGNVPSGVTADEMITPEYVGAWAVNTNTAAASMAALPEEKPGTFEVLVSAQGNISIYVIQRYTADDGSSWVRHVNGNTLKFTDWKPQNWNRGYLPNTAQIDTLHAVAHEGTWGVLGGNNQVVGLPSKDHGILTIKVMHKGISSWYTLQHFATASGERWSRWWSGPQQVWSEWVNSTAKQECFAGAANDRKDVFLASRGGRIGTGGKGVVALRFDHSLTPFYDTILPLLRARGLPATLPCFVNMMTPSPEYTNDDSSGKTWTDLAQTFYRGVEIFSHSYSHLDANTNDGLRKEIVESRTALETNVPDVRVHGWAQPGVGGTNYNGWLGASGAANDPNLRSGHDVQKLISSTYPVWASGVTGVSSLGESLIRHTTIEKLTSAGDAKAAIDEAIATTSATTLMLHPNRIGTTDYISVATFTEILDYIVAKRDAGEITVLTMGGIALADPATDYRHSLVPNIAGWAGSPSGTMSYTLDLAKRSSSTGVVREFAVDCAGSGSVKLTVEDISSTVPMNVYTSTAIPNGGTARLQVGIPRRAKSLKFTVEATGVTITNAGVYAV